MEKKNTNIGLSVLIPIYNTAEYLRQCIDSVLCQKTIVNIQLILVDDGSTDLSGNIADEYAKADSRISVFHKSNQGVSSARNMALEMAKGEYIVFLDSDDWLMNDSLDFLYSTAKEHRADMVMGNALFYYSPEKIERRYDKILPDCVNIPITGEQGFVRLMELSSFAPMVYNYIYRREWLEALGIKFEDISHEDELWTVITLCQAERVVITNHDFYYYRQRKGSLMHNGIPPQTRIDSLYHLIKKLALFSDKYALENYRELKSWLQVKIYVMYYEAFAALARFKSRSYNPPGVPRMPDLAADNQWLSPLPKTVCRYHWNRTALKFREYKDWLSSFK